MILSRFAPYLLILLAIVVVSLLVLMAVDHSLAVRVFADAPDVMSRHP